ncbi:hypothetical protein ACHAXM_003441 [Skeletonema potamos]
MRIQSTTGGEEK